MNQRKKRLVRVLAAAAALILCVTGVVVLTSAEEDAPEVVSSYPYTTVTKEQVNLRASRSVRSTLLKKIPAGKEITVRSKVGTWAEVDYGKYSGWVKTDYIVLKEVKKIRVTPTPTPVPTLSPEENAGGYIILKAGSSGSEVRALQEALIELGFLTGKADGSFGAATEKAVIAFQKANSYPDTGLMDANIQAYLYSGKPINAKGTAVKINTLSPAAGATMRLNNTGEAVGKLQERLKELGYYTGDVTEKYDEATRKAVIAFQKKNNLKADGVAGADTQKAIRADTALGANETPTPTPSPTPSPEPTWEIPATVVKSGSEGADVKAVQKRLKELGYYPNRVDGVFGRASVNALKNFQTANGLEADGIGGKETYKILFSANAKPYSAEPSETPEASEEPTEEPTQTPEATSSVWKTMRLNDKGDNVFQLQEALIQLGYMAGKPDSVYGAQTAAAVKAFQKANGLQEDGVAGEETQKMIFSGEGKAAEVRVTATPTVTPRPTATPTATPAQSSGTELNTSVTLKQGSEGNDVKALQRKLIELGYLTGTADGVYGSRTASAVAAFQTANKLTADGVAGSRTLEALKNGKKATAAATATPAPAATAAASALEGRPKASSVIYANWYTTVKEICRKYPYATVYDFSTGISWQVHIFSLGAHADYEPVTANDTARMQRAFGGETTWTAKAVWVVFADGSVYIGSTHDTPHGTSHTADNNFNGHSCLHFPRTQEQVTAIGPYATSHQETIDKGWAETQKLK